MTHEGDAIGIVDVVAGECAQVSEVVGGLSDEFLATRALEIAVHGLDLADLLG